MKIMFGDWAAACEGYCFTVEMDYVPQPGDSLWIDQSLVPPMYFEETEYGPLAKADIDGTVSATVGDLVKHTITKDGVSTLVHIKFD